MLKRKQQQQQHGVEQKHHRPGRNNNTNKGHNRRGSLFLVLGVIPLILVIILIVYDISYGIGTRNILLKQLQQQQQGQQKSQVDVVENNSANGSTVDAAAISTGGSDAFTAATTRTTATAATTAGGDLAKKNTNAAAEVVIQDGSSGITTNINDNATNVVWPNPQLLQRIADRIGNTIIVLTVTCGYVEMLQNWLLHVWKLEDGGSIITNFLIVAQDDIVYPIVKQYLKEYSQQQQKDMDLSDHVILLDRTNDISHVLNSGKPYKFQTKGFHTVAVQRPHIMLSILQQGYNVIHTDIDLIWLQNPLRKIEEVQAAAAQASSSSHSHSYFDYIGIVDADVITIENGRNSTNEIHKYICAAFIYLRSNNITKAMLQYWKDRMDETNNKQIYKSRDKKHAGHTIGNQPLWKQTLTKFHGTYTMKTLSQYGTLCNIPDIYFVCPPALQI